MSFEPDSESYAVTSSNLAHTRPQCKHRPAMPGDLYYGDNLELLRNPSKFVTESIDLIYLDPPFNSDRTYNLINKGSQTQERAFVDTWNWEEDSAQRSFAELTGDAPQGVRVPEALTDMMRSLKKLLWDGNKDMLAYLSMMAVRLVELHRVLRGTGSLYLHCDPTASHYLKMILDAIFGLKNFRNEIIWRRTGAHNGNRCFGPIHDVILFYSKNPKDYYFKVVNRPYMRGHVERRYKRDSTGEMKFSSGGNVLTGSGIRGGESGAEWRGFKPSSKDRHWAIPGFLAQQMPLSFNDLGVLAKLDALFEKGLVEIIPGTAWPTPVRYLTNGNPMQDIWAYQPYTENTVHGTSEGIDVDVKWLGPTGPERVGYSTQKPLGILDRILSTSCPADGIVLDPFCGCGTTVVAAQKLGIKWIGIDIAIRAIDVIKDRLDERFQPYVWTEYGEPSGVEEAAHLAETNHYDFQWWVVRRLGGQPPKGQKKKGGDGGVDGEMTLQDFGSNTQRKVVISVKGGTTLTPGMVKDLESTVRLEKADYGIFVSMYSPTPGMKSLAKEFGTVPGTAIRDSKPEYRIRIITVPEILAGTVRLPGVNVTPRYHSSPPPAEPRKGETLQLL